jgi:hypothetical protein
MDGKAEGVELQDLSEAEFSRRLGQPFGVRLRSGEILDAILVEVTPHPYLPLTPERRRGFSIVLKSALPGHLPQAIYTVEHPQMGSMDLFLVPIGPREGGMCYEAVFN